MKETGFASGEFNDEQMNAKALPKSERATVLNKAFQLVNKTLGIEVDISAGKVTAGKECEKTRVFLQYFCIAAQGGSVDAGGQAAPSKAKSKTTAPAPAPAPATAPLKTDDDVVLPTAPRNALRP